MSKKILMMITVVFFTFVMIGCTPIEEPDPDPITCDTGYSLVDGECVEDEVDCDANPDHEDCVEDEVDCQIHPQHVDCVEEIDLSAWDDVNGRTITFFDDFDGDELDTSVWEHMIGTGHNYGIGYWGNSEEQYYTDTNTVVSDGELQIIVRKEQTPSDGNSAHIMQYTSARIRTEGTFSQAYGRFEARVRLESPDQGIWPAFWLLPEDNVYGGWPHSGEIDIMELRGRLTDHTTAALHYSYIRHTYDHGSYYYENGTDMSDYHVYAVEWTPTRMTWYCDDQIVLDLDNWQSAVGDFPAPFDQEFHILINVAVGGNFDGGRLPSDSNLPATLYVDYVKVLAWDGAENGRKIPEGTGDVYLMNDTVTMSLTDETVDLEAFVFGGQLADVAWFTSDSSIAVVNQAGRVTAIAPGTVEISVKTGSSEATCRITITDD